MEQQALKLKEAILQEQRLLTEYVKKSCTRMQQVVDQTTTFVYNYLQPELSVIFHSLEKGYTGIIYPVLHHLVNDVAPNYGSSIKVEYILCAVNPEEPAEKSIVSRLNFSHKPNLHKEYNIFANKLRNLYDMGIKINEFPTPDATRYEAIKEQLLKRK